MKVKKVVHMRKMNMGRLREIINAGTVTLAVKIGPKLLSVAVKFAKVGKVGLAISTGVTYAYLFTWQFAIMIMILLFIHESGHIWAMKKCGLKTKGIYFIPFLGAAAVTEEMFKSRRDEVYIAIMGPIWGFVVSVATAGVWVITGDTFFAAAAGWMAMVNLFNLLPVNPLDGGRIMKSIAFSIDSKIGFIFLVIGIIASIILTFWVGMVLFLILLLVACIELIFECHSYSRKKEIAELLKENPDIDLGYIREKYEIPPPLTKKGILISGIAYVIVIAILWALMTEMNHVPEVELARKFFMS